ncbi:hypothetical protein T12_16849 [Trichinella patagoniensis]|uniref:Uncharacterized protein n=1 Tax=Trichinella patagoniensis TaxID=990121 RepID=A0A0V0ZJ33_9BILA|nr:hypothetical protein T12_16849 [Trichinella patagoniensis]
MSKQLKSATNEISLMKWLHAILQINLTSLMSHWLKLFWYWAFFNDELRQIFQVFSGTLFTNSNLLQYHYYCNKKCGSTPLLRIAYLRSLGSNLLLSLLSLLKQRDISKLVVLELKLTNLWTIYWKNEYLSIENNFEEI